MNSITKVCNTCGEEKPITDFYFRKDNNKYREDCKKCNKAYHAKYYRDNIDDMKIQSSIHSKIYYQNNKEQKRKYAIENKEKIATRMAFYQKDYYKKNKERIDKKNRLWVINNPEKATVLRAKRRNLEHNLTETFTEQEWRELCKKYDYRCLMCGEKKPLTHDHVIPLSKGGRGTIDNIQPLCKSCNSTKRAKIMDFRR